MNEWNPWKVTTLGLVLVVATALITGVVVARWSGGDRSAVTSESTTSAPAASIATQAAPATSVAPPPSPHAVAEAGPPSQSAIEACNRLRRRLVIIGSGQDGTRLRALAGPTVHFLGWQPNGAVRNYLRRCRALLFPGEEDFGIVPVEAQACGAPVIAYGQGGATGFAQIVADALGVDLRDVTVRHGDTALIPTGDGTAGSRTLVVGGSAIFRAAQTLRRTLLERAATRLEARLDDLVLAGGRVFVRGVPSRGFSLGQLASGGRHGRGLAASGRYTVRGATFPFGTHIAVVEIDPETGDVRLLQYLSVDDCGVVINPLLVDGQIHGGVAQATGQALSEEFVYDDSGQPLTATLLDYAIPHAASLPRIVTLRTETPSPRNPLGAKGVGEAGTVGATPAVANAVIDALAPFGVRHLDMPLTPRKVWTAVSRARAQEPWRRSS